MGNISWAPFLTSTLRSSNDTTIVAAQGARFKPDVGGCSLNQLFIQPNSVPFCKGLEVSNAPVNGPTKASNPSHARATAVRVLMAACRIGPFWSERTVATDGTRSFTCFSKGLPIPVAIRDTMSKAKDCTGLFASVTRAFKTEPISPKENMLRKLKETENKTNPLLI